MESKLIIEEIKSFLGKEGLDYLKENYKKDNFYFVWGTCIGGCVGMQVRNHLTYKYPELLKEFKSYGDYEDYTTELMKSILREYEDKV